MTTSASRKKRAPFFSREGQPPTREELWGAYWMAQRSTENIGTLLDGLMDAETGTPLRDALYDKGSPLVRQAVLRWVASLSPAEMRRLDDEVMEDVSVLIGVVAQLYRLSHIQSADISAALGASTKRGRPTAKVKQGLTKVARTRGAPSAHGLSVDEAEAFLRQARNAGDARTEVELLREFVRCRGAARSQVVVDRHAKSLARGLRERRRTPAKEARNSG